MQPKSKFLEFGRDTGPGSWPKFRVGVAFTWHKQARVSDPIPTVWPIHAHIILVISFKFNQSLIKSIFILQTRYLSYIQYM
jgi:hypothetical protein